jgi:predicted DNA-binding transcriptional regulator AlpA
MVCIARANRVAIQKILPTRNLWRGLPQNAGASAACPRQIKIGGNNLAEKMFMRVNEVAEALDVSEPYAYKLIRKLNEELKQKGCIVIAGRIDRRFFYEKFYGSNTKN